MNNSHMMFFDIKDYWTPLKKYGSFDPEHEYRILVPLDEDAEERMYRYQLYDDKGVSPDFLCLEFREDTFYIMEDYFFNVLDYKLDIIITMYEEEVIYTERLDEAMDIIRSVLDNTDDPAVKDFGNKLLDMFMTAKEHNTVVGFYF